MGDVDSTQWDSVDGESQDERLRAAHRHLLHRDLLLHLLLSLAVVAAVCALFDIWRQAPILFVICFVPIVMRDLKRAAAAR